ncbi:MAG: Cell division protein FtsL [candidate division WS2 bacterium]|nr:Cell division protein FtsL [Candidatus Lithacetigena glycinireducens]MBT9175141.1 Cell division protein FtsL [Candidatus Lithacetigena glycinireducens]
MKKLFFQIVEIAIWVLAITSIFNFVMTYSNYLVMKNEMKALEMQIIEEKKIISNLDMEIAKLKTPKGIEQAIREKIEMAKPGEIIIKLDKP